MNISGIVKQEEQFVTVIEEETIAIDRLINKYASNRDSVLHEIDRLMTQYNELENCVNTLVIPSGSFLEHESRFNSINPESFTLTDYSDIDAYIVDLSELINNLESDKWKNIISWIEEHPKFYKFKQNASGNQEKATGIHISDFFLYTRQEIDELERVSIGFFGRSIEDQAALYKLYSVFKGYADSEEELLEAINYNKKKLSKAEKRMDQWKIWRKASLSDIDSRIKELRANTNYNDSVSKLISSTITKIQYRFNPREIKYQAQYFMSLDSFDSSICNKRKIKLSDVSDEIVLGISRKKLSVNPKNQEAKQFLDQVLGIYDGIFEKELNCFTYVYPIICNPNDSSFKNYIRIDDNQSYQAYIVTAYWYMKLTTQIPWPTRYICVGDCAKEMDFLVNAGASITNDPSNIARSLYDELLLREKKMGGKYFYQFNKEQILEGEEIQSAIIIFIYNFDAYKLRTYKEPFQEVLERGARFGIYAFEISPKTSLFSVSHQWFYSDNRLISDDQKQSIKIPIDIELDTIESISRNKSNKYQIDAITMPNDISISADDLSKLIMCPIGTKPDGKIISTEISANYNAMLISGTPYSGKTNTIHVLLDTLLNIDKENTELFLVDMQLGGFDYVEDIFCNKGNMKVLVFDSDSQSVYTALLILVNHIRKMADSFRRNHVQNWEDYQHKTGNTIPKRILIIDGIESMPLASTETVKKIIMEGSRYNIQVILSGIDKYDFEKICQVVLWLGVNKKGIYYPNEIKGVGFCSIDGQKNTVQIYHHRKRNQTKLFDYTAERVICGCALDNPKSLLSLFERNLITEIASSFKLGTLDIGCNTNQIMYINQAQSISLDEADNLLLLGGNQNQVYDIYLHMILNIVIEGLVNNESPRIYLMKPADSRLISLSQSLKNIIEIITINSFVEIREEFKARKTFVFIENMNSNPSFAFHIDSESMYQIEPEGDFIRQCITSNNVHLITWCDTPNNIHPFFMSGNSCKRFQSMFAYQIIMRMGQHMLELTNNDVMSESNELSESTAWIKGNKKPRELISLYRGLSDDEIHQMLTCINNYKR